MLCQKSFKISTALTLCRFRNCCGTLSAVV